MCSWDIKNTSSMIALIDTQSKETATSKDNVRNTFTSTLYNGNINFTTYNNCMRRTTVH